MLEISEVGACGTIFSQSRIFGIVHMVMRVVRIPGPAVYYQHGRFILWLF